MMSDHGQDERELGISYSVVDLDGVPTMVYHYEEDMADTTTSSVKLVGEVVTESNEPSILLPTLETFSAADLSGLISA